MVKNNVLVRKLVGIETAGNLNVLFTDKTGTLTEGVFIVQKINSIGISEEELIEIAAYAEWYSNHPIAKSVKQEYSKNVEEVKIKNLIRIAGHYVRVMLLHMKTLKKPL